MPESTIQQARSEAQAALGQLDSRYESDKAELRAQFQLAETDAEKSALARALGELNAARDEGVKAIASGFARARADVSGRADSVAAGVEGHAQGIGDLYRDASASITGSGERASELAASFGVGANVGGRNIGAVDDLAAAAELAGAREQTLAGRLGNITVEDLRWLADNIGAQSEAAQAGLRGDAMGLSAGLMSEHANRVGDRIGRETSQWQAQLGALQGDFRQRGFQLEDQDIGLLAQLAQMRHATQMQREQIAAQKAIAAANRRASGSAGSDAMARMLKQREWELEDRALEDGSSFPAAGTPEGDLFWLELQDQFGPQANQFGRTHGFLPKLHAPAPSYEPFDGGAGGGGASGGSGFIPRVGQNIADAFSGDFLPDWHNPARDFLWGS